MKSVEEFVSVSCEAKVKSENPEVTPFRLRTVGYIDTYSDTGILKNPVSLSRSRGSFHIGTKRISSILFTSLL